MNTVLNFLLVFFFILGIISFIGILYVEIDCRRYKERNKPWVLYKSITEVAIYDDYYKELSFFRGDKLICVISKHCIEYKDIPYSSIYESGVKVTAFRLLGFHPYWNKLPITQEWQKVRCRNERDFLRSVQRIEEQQRRAISKHFERSK